MDGHRFVGLVDVDETDMGCMGDSGNGRAEGERCGWLVVDF